MRKLLLVHDGCSDTKSHVIAFAGNWTVYPADKIESTHRLAAEKNIPVGIIRIHDDGTNVSGHPIEKVLAATPGTLWVAIVESNALKNPLIRELISTHCFDYHTLPIDLERLQVTLGRAFGMSTLTKSNPPRQSESSDASNLIVGRSDPIRKLRQTLRKVAAVDAPVLITGESGTGKELVAQTIHNLSSRSDGPFVAVNCAALPESLIQSELFGHQKGAFTSADRTKIGRIQSADNGTILLDEIGDLSLETQAILLRFLQEKTIEQVGSTKTVRVNARVITATHVDLRHAVAQGTFREDLFHRLHVLHVETPPLRACRADLDVLAYHFFNKFADEKQSRLRGFSHHAMQFMHCYSWPGNVREFMNCIRRAMVMSDGRFVTIADLGLERRARDRRLATLEEMRSEADKHAIQCALEEAHYQISTAAEILGVSRVTLYRLLDKYEIQRPATETSSGKAKNQNTRITGVRGLWRPRST